MPSVARCPGCATELDVGDDVAPGQAVECPVCLARFTPARPAGEAPRRDDGGDDRPRRGRGYALRQVAGPARGLQVIGWIGVALNLLNVLLTAAFGMVVVAAPGPPGGGGPGFQGLALFAATALTAATGALTSGVVVYGAAKMRRLERYGWAQAAAWLSVLPCFATQAVGSCCFLSLALGLPCYIASLVFGIQAIQALNDPAVKAKFDYGRDDEG